MMMLTIYEDAMYMNSNAIGIREWLSYGYMMDVIPAGVSCLRGFIGLDSTNWIIATIRDAINMLSKVQSIRCSCSTGHLSSYNEGGITCELCYLYLDNTFWSFATYK